MRQAGSFTINRQIWQDMGFIGREVLMEGVVVWHTNWHSKAQYDLDEISFSAEHRDFNFVPEGEMIPKYVAEFTSKDGHITSRKWVQVE